MIRRWKALVRQLFATTSTIKQRSSRRNSRVWLEQLETRLAPASYVVNNATETVEMGKLNLAQAIAMSNGTAPPQGEANYITLSFQPGQVIALTKPLPTIKNNPVSIYGGKNVPTITGNRVVAIGFDISGVTAMIQNLNIICFAQAEININGVAGPNSVGVSNNWIGTTKGGGNGLDGGLKDGIDVTNSSNVVITGNTINNNAQNGISVTNGPSFGNPATQPGGPLQLQKADNISRNTIANEVGGKQQVGIAINKSSNVWIRGNTITGQMLNGISITAGQSNVLANNYIGITPSNLVGANGKGAKYNALDRRRFRCRDL